MPAQLSHAQLIDQGLDPAGSTALLSQINQAFTLPEVECWQQLTRDVLTPEQPFAFHRLLHDTVFAQWDASNGPAPIWIPTDEDIQTSNIAALMRDLGLATYADLHAWSVQHRADYWDQIVRRLHIRLQEQYDCALDLSAGAEKPQWFAGATLNIVDSCFNADADAPAIVYQRQDGPLSTLSYGDLRALCNRIANSLADRHFGPGDAIAIAMPMTVESVAIYLGIIAAGCTVVSIADSFSAAEIATRLRIAGARAVFTQDVIPRGDQRLPLYARLVEADAPRAIVLACDASLQIELRPADLVWNDFLGTKETFAPVPRRPGDHINILFSSGTTGEPKAIPWTQTTPIKCAADGCLHHDIQPSEVVAWPTNLGWMMGPWLIFASLINRATIALCYDLPTSRGFAEFVQNAQVNMLGVVPSLVRAWRDSDCPAGLNWRAIKAFSSTGECSDPEDMHYLMVQAGYRPVVEYCGGTEIGGGYITGTLVQAAAPSTFTTAALGLDFVLLDDDEQPADSGEVFILPPSIGLSTELLNRDHHQVYFSAPTSPDDDIPLRRHGDQIERLPKGYYRAHGRVDDTMNLGGIKVSSAEIERVLNEVEGVGETATIAVSPLGGGPSQLVVYVVSASDTTGEIEVLREKLQKAIRTRLNPLFKIGDVVVADSLPRTASNKVMRRVLRDQYMS